VELFCGLAHRKHGDWSVVDTPGVVDLTSSREDEQISRDVALFGHADVVVQVADAKNLERDLVLTVQLAELGAPVLVVNSWICWQGRRLGNGRHVRSQPDATSSAKTETRLEAQELRSDAAEARSSVMPSRAARKTRP